jgi:hypothetical protein
LGGIIGLQNSKNESTIPSDNAAYDIDPYIKLQNVDGQDAAQEKFIFVDKSNPSFFINSYLLL